MSIEIFDLLNLQGERPRGLAPRADLASLRKLRFPGISSQAEGGRGPELFYSHLPAFNNPCPALSRVAIFVACVG
jgi:hypothetical protein